MNTSSSNLNPKTLYSAIHSALRAWHLGVSPEGLLDFLSVVKEKQASLGESPAVGRLATNEVLLALIEQMESSNPLGAQILRARFIDKRSVASVANSLNEGRDYINKQQRLAINSVAQMLYLQEEVARDRRIHLLESQLEVSSYDRLFGLEEARASLSQMLLADEPPWVMTIVGIGGIGKTALADSLTRQLIREFRFDEVIWLRVDKSEMASPDEMLEQVWSMLVQHLWPEEAGGIPATQRLGLLRQALKAKPYLIVIDNLETKAETAYLLPHLGDLANPSKFVVTSRFRPVGQGGHFIFSLNELGRTDAMALLRHQAAMIGLYELAEGNEKEMVKIYEMVGGNPLALKLVVGLAQVLPLPELLAEFQRGKGGQVEQMYCQIYWRIWQTMSDEAQALLQAMPLIGKFGARTEQMEAISGLSKAQLWPAITELVSRSLLEVQGTPWARRYGIHRLTDSFLQTEIIRWPSVAQAANL